MIVVNVLGIAPSDIEKLGLRSLSKTSPYLQSAYRNEKGNGGLLVGRVDAAFESLPLEGKIAAANEMVESFEIQGIREAMLYDARGRMQVHYMAGELRRPRPGNRSSSKQPGQGAVRGSLMAAPLDEAMRKANRPADEDDFWAEDDS